MARETATSTVCQECNERPSLYQCPRCSRMTCSLTCCKAHKDRTGCTGKRNRTEFLSLARMSDASIRSDYFFLEDVLQDIDRGKRLLKDVGAATSTHASSNKKPRFVANETDYDDPGREPVHPILMMKEEKDGFESLRQQRPNGVLPPRWRRLVEQAQTRGTTLMLMPKGMQRHVSNTTWYHIETDTIHWKADFCLHGNDRKRIISISKLDENANVAEQLSRRCPDFTSDYHLLLKRLPSPSNRPIYVELDRETSTLKYALRDLTVIEYPTIEVVQTKDLSRFPRSIEEVK